MLTDDRERISALELCDGRAHRLEQVAHGREVEMDTVGNDFGVGLGGELVTGTLQLLAQLLMIFDDSVVNDREAVARDVRVRVALTRDPMRRPARVGDADLADGGILLERLLQHLYLADGSEAREMPRAVQDSQTGRVIAAVLEPPQSLHENGDDVTFGDGSNDSAHVLFGLDS